jgi:hypothetical protein
LFNSANLKFWKFPESVGLKSKVCSENDGTKLVYWKLGATNSTWFAAWAKKTLVGLNATDWFISGTKLKTGIGA